MQWYGFHFAYFKTSWKKPLGTYIYQLLWFPVALLPPNGDCKASLLWKAQVYFYQNGQTSGGRTAPSQSRDHDRPSRTAYTTAWGKIACLKVAWSCMVGRFFEHWHGVGMTDYREIMTDDSGMTVGLHSKKLFSPGSSFSKSPYPIYASEASRYILT